MGRWKMGRIRKREAEENVKEKMERVRGSTRTGP